MRKKELLAKLRNLLVAIDSIGGTNESNALRRYLAEQIVAMMNRVKATEEFNV